MTDSTTGDLDLIERMTRAACRVGCGLEVCRKEGRCTAGPEIVEGFIAQTITAALKAHAEWLAEQGLVVVPDNDYSFWARVVELPQHRKEILYDFIKKEAEFAKS